MLTATLLIITAAALIYTGVKIRNKEQLYSQMKQVPALVIDRHLEQIPPDSPENDFQYSIDIVYEYSYEGSTYIAGGMHPPYEPTDAITAQQSLDRIPDEILVNVPPGAPEKGIYVRAPRYWMIILFIGWFLFLLGFGLFLM